MPKYKFYREGESEPTLVEPERWRWIAHYDDGSIMKQFDDDGFFHPFKHIKQDRLVQFGLECEGRPPVIFLWKPDYKLIHFYRNVVLNNGESCIRLYCCGYESDSNGKCMAVIMPDDTVVITDDVDNIIIG